MKKNDFITAENAVLYFFFFAFTALAFFSIEWPVVHDTLTFLNISREFINYGSLPYRDFHEENTPLVYIIYFSISRLFGATHFGFRIADLLLLSSCLSLIYFIFKNTMSNRKLMISIFMVGTMYLTMSQREVLQRDSFAIILVLFLMNRVFEVSKGHNLTLNGLLGGFLIGTLVSLKPYFIIWGMISFLVLFLLKRLPTHKNFYILGVLGGIISPLLSLFFLFYYNIQNEFFNMATNYWPLYSSFNFYPSEVTNLYIEKLLLNLYHFLNFGRQESFVGLFLSVCLGGYTLRETIKVNKFQLISFAFALTSLLIPAFNNRYLPHYYLPSFFLCIPFIIYGFNESKLHKSLIVVLISLFIVSNVGRILWDKDAYFRKYNDVIANQQAQKIRDYGGKQGDSILTFGWAGDVSFSTLDKLQGRFANRYIYAQHFFHNMEANYIKKIRNDFISRLSTNLPRFIILDPLQNSYYEKLEGSSLETLFPEFSEIIRNYYKQIYYLHEGTKEYRVYTLKL